jgi:hypothetical protein
MGVMVLFYKLGNTTADFVAGEPHGQATIPTCRRKRRRNINAKFAHRSYRLRVQETRFRSGADNLEVIAGQVTKKPFGHLRAAGILRTDE